MLTPFIASLMLAAPDTILAKMTIGTEKPGEPAIEWVMRDTSLVPIDLGKTPYATEFNAAEKPFTVRAVGAAARIRVTLRQKG